MVSGELVLGGLLGANVLLYALLAFALFAPRKRRAEPKDLTEAFGYLEVTLKETEPDLPSGFTWEEAIHHMRSSGVQTEAVEGALQGYEAYRFGGGPLPDTDYRNLVVFSKRLGGRPRKRAAEG